MLGLGKHGPDGQYGVIVDINSGSVGVGIVASDPFMTLPEVIWTHRERTSIRDIENLEHFAQDISTALMNAFLTLGAKGFKSLREHDPKSSINQVQVLVSAPWSYTIVKSITSKSDDPFEITKSLVEELVSRAEKEALALMDADEVMSSLGLEAITSETINIKANGYSVPEPYGQEVKNISLTQVKGLANKKLLTTLHEVTQKIIPDAAVKSSTFMFAYYQTLSHSYPDTSEVCLIDITSEATELGIVREGILKYVTHMPYGAYTLAREISGLCDIPKEEALGYIRSNDVDITKSFSESKLKELASIVDAYEEKLADLFKRTGDALSIPKTIFIHTNTKSETFFKQRIDGATNKSHKGEYKTHLVTSKLFENTDSNDTALLLSAYVFHKNVMNHSFT